MTLGSLGRCVRPFHNCSTLCHHHAGHPSLPWPTFQRRIAAHNAHLEEDRRIELRAGLNLGDVMVDDGDIYGDGVNIAARLESIAEPGGLCVSGPAFDHLKSNVPVGYEYLGERAVKNISQPVRVYKVRLEPEAAGTLIGGPRRVAWRRGSAWAAVAAVVVVTALANR